MTIQHDIGAGAESILAESARLAEAIEAASTRVRSSEIAAHAPSGGFQRDRALGLHRLEYGQLVALVRNHIGTYGCKTRASAHGVAANAPEVHCCCAGIHAQNMHTTSWCYTIKPCGDIRQSPMHLRYHTGHVIVVSTRHRSSSGPTIRQLDQLHSIAHHVLVSGEINQG